MPYELELPKALRQHWKVKILDKETLYEEPHLTIFSGGKKWRYGLRRRDFLDSSPSPGDVSKQVIKAIDAAYALLCREWDVRFPNNRVHGHAEEE